MNYLVIDFETGGLEPKEHAITEVGIVVINGDTLKILEEYQSYIYPYDKKYDQQALTATNISLKLLESKGKPAKEVCVAMEAVMQRHTARSFKDKLIWVGHNPLFDVGFCNDFLKQFSKNSLEKYFTGQKFDSYFIPTHFDTMTLARAKWKRENIAGGSYSLTNVCQKSGIELSDAHGALNDTVATNGVFTLFINHLRSTISGVQVADSNNTGNRFRTHFEIEA